ncbi:hypothetical protein SNEBB_006455 [Seison nebaliae]|nr:hypothetical protein SNEBB_006455 [Seison nebaliae]
MVGGNNKDWYYNFRNATVSKNPIPPDLESITPLTDHYFHKSLTSNSYDLIIYEIYDGRQRPIKITFTNKSQPNTLSWFNNHNIKDIETTSAIEQSIHSSFRDAIFKFQHKHLMMSCIPSEVSLKFHFTNFINCPILDLTCNGKPLPLILYQTKIIQLAKSMSQGTHIVITGVEHNKE